MLGNIYPTQLPQVANHRVFEKEGHTISNWSKMQYQFCTSVIVKWWTFDYYSCPTFQRKIYLYCYFTFNGSAYFVSFFFEPDTLYHIRSKWPKKWLN